VICLHEFTWTDHTEQWTKLQWCPNCGCVRVDGKDWIQPYRDWRERPTRDHMVQLVRQGGLMLAISLTVGVLLGLWLATWIGG
jgi:hypothetical protein